MTTPPIASPEWYLTTKDASTDIARLTIFHYGFKQATNNTLIFPSLDYSSPLSVLDIGTADGLWMYEVASSLPPLSHGTHTFLGTDINESFFPSTSAPNITFEKQDIRDPVPESWHQKFDLINMRMILIAAGSGSSQRDVLLQHIKLLKPGGWIQIGDCDRVCPTPVEENPKYHDFFKCIRAVCEASGADPLEAVKMRGWLEEAGLEDVQERTAMRKVGASNEDEKLGRRGIEADLVIAEGYAKAVKGEWIYVVFGEKCDSFDFE